MLARLVENMLVGVRPTDPVSLGLVSVVLLITALGAALGPGIERDRGEPDGRAAGGVMAIPRL